eukprot:SAG31_NODE_25647_length_457_cov_1.011173_1_plen_23_part_10
MVQWETFRYARGLASAMHRRERR